jgi:hypothetical protein
MSNYLEATAARIRAAVAPDVDVPSDSGALFLMYAVLMRAKGTAVQAVDVHDAWVAWMTQINPDHDALRPYEQLDAETRAYDEPFVTAIRQTAKDSEA